MANHKQLRVTPHRFQVSRTSLQLTVKAFGSIEYPLNMIHAQILLFMHRNRLGRANRILDLFPSALIDLPKKESRTYLSAIQIMPCQRAEILVAEWHCLDPLYHPHLLQEHLPNLLSRLECELLVSKWKVNARLKGLIKGIHAICRKE